MVNIKKYLDRIKVDSTVTPDLDNLKKLHANHLYNIPFENLDIHRNIKIILDPKHLEKKILDGKRGGYCYELNGMFYLLLKELGYDVKMISARVSNAQGGWGQEFDHMAIIVNLDEQWVADVGFGDSFIEPLKFELDNEQKNISGCYKIVEHDDEYFRLMKSAGRKEFSNEYIFTTTGRQLHEFEGMNKYQQTSPDSHFRKGKICTIANPNGRIALSNDKLTITAGDNKTVIEIKDENDFREKLYELFGIE